MLTEHTSRCFDLELETLRLRVMKMGGLVEDQIINAIDALTNKKIDLANEVIENEHKVNAMKVTIDELCEQIIARRQPTAMDFRLLMTSVKIITDLERIGNEAKKIADITKSIYPAERLSNPRLSEIKLMSNMVLDLLSKSLDGFARLDLSAAIQVPRQDLLVDEAYRSCMKNLIIFMKDDPRTISTSIQVLFAAKAIEQIGNHAKNMSEYLVYMVKGTDVRHTSLEEMER